MSENETPRTHTSSQQPDRERGEESAGSSGLASSLFKSLDGLRRRVSDQRRAVHSSAPEKAPASAASDALPRDAAEAVPWSLRVGAAVFRSRSYLALSIVHNQETPRMSVTKTSVSPPRMPAWGTPREP